MELIMVCETKEYLLNQEINKLDILWLVISIFSYLFSSLFRLTSAKLPH